MSIDRKELARKLTSDRDMSERWIQRGYYPHANRGYLDYQLTIPTLKEDVEKLLTTRGKIRGLDIGCGTSRAAAMMMHEHGTNLVMEGVTLNYFPPLQGDNVLPREKIKICRAGNTGFPPKSFDLIVAIGSLTTTGTVFSEGIHVLKLVAPGGRLYIAPIDELLDMDDARALKEYAEDHGFIVSFTPMHIRDLRFHTATFTRQEV